MEPVSDSVTAAPGAAPDAALDSAHQALLAEGGQLADAAGYVKRVNALLLG
jgi:hypothetical protein